jgi:hypothetical protein
LQDLEVPAAPPVSDHGFGNAGTVDHVELEAGSALSPDPQPDVAPNPAITDAHLVFGDALKRQVFAE